MANSKANIYPIQLQGAELCLNKFDAEIKQYSGFNKNNAPFVGGCLSNIFTKNEIYNSSSVFIDEEENVYTISDTELYKNDKIIKSWAANNIFWHREKIELYDYAIRVFAEKIQLIKKTTGFYLKTNADEYFIRNFTSTIDNETIAYNQCHGIFIRLNGVNLFIFAICFNGFAGVMVINADTGVLISRLDEVTGIVYKTDYPIAICYANSQLSVFARYEAEHGTHDYGMVADFYTINSSNNVSSLIYGVYSFSSNWINSQSAAMIPDLDYWRISSYPYNTAFLQNSSSLGDGSVGKDLVISIKSLYYDTYGVRPLTIKKATNNVVNIYECEKIQQQNLAEGVTTSLASCFDFQYYTTSQPGYSRKFMCIHQNSYEHDLLGFSYSSIIFNSETQKKGSYVMGDFMPLGNTFHLLFNNNQFSGIAGQQVLLSNWNSVELKTLCFKTGTYDGETKESLCYKEGDIWYKLYSGTPDFRVLGNQIIINIDVALNAYDFKTDRELGFAPAFNGIKNYIITSTGVEFDSSISNNYIFACAINEYNLEDNASIILNPINLYKHPNSFNPQPYTWHDINFYDNSETQDTVVKYQYTLKKEVLNVIHFYNKDLLGLPYPTDSNGNVMYSPNLFMDIVSSFGNNVYVKTSNKGYPLVIGNNLKPVFSYYLGNEVENLEMIFVIQGQPYVIINGYIYSIYFNNGVIGNIQSVVSVENMQFCGNAPYEALFYSKTNRCLYSFTGANVLQTKQFVDKISVIKSYKYNPATQSIFLLSDIGVIVSSLFGIYCIDMPEAERVFLLNNGVVLCDNSGHYRYVKYYKEDTDEDYIKENIKLETMFYGMDNQTVTINDCLYMRLFSEEHEEGEVKISATTISLEGRKTEETVFKYKSSDWDKVTHTIYMRYQPKTQRGLGISFNIESPFKIASMSVGSQADAILVDKVSKGAITAPFNNNSSNIEW